MFYRGYSILTALARSESIPAPHVPEALMDWADSNAKRALTRDLRAMPLSQRRADPAGYRHLQQTRRQDLEALLIVSPTEPVVMRALDLVCMIAEESVWSANAGQTPFDDDGHPDIDFQSAETAMLFAWTLRTLGQSLNAISPRIASRMLNEVRRRLFAPFLAHVDYPFMRGRGVRPLAILSDILLSAILLEADGARRSAVLKQALRLLDQAIAARGEQVQSLADAAADIGAITDLCLLLRKITRGEMDLTPVYPTPDWLDELLFPWVDGEYFVDPAGEGMKPELSGEELFRIGLSANDEALTALGARLHRATHRPSATLTGRYMAMACAPALASDFDKPPRLRHAATSHNALMISRFCGLTCAMHAGGGHGNAGNIILFAGSRPVMAEIPGHVNLPIVAGHAQLDHPDLPCEADFEVREDRELMSIDLTHAYPTAAAVRSYQRTAMILREEDSLRLVDAFDLSSPGRIAFRFVFTEKPLYIQGKLQVGPVDLSWEGDLTLDVSPLTAEGQTAEGLYQVELTTPSPVTRAFFAFTASLAER